MTELLSSLLTQLVLAFAALVANATDAEPRSRIEPAAEQQQVHDGVRARMAAHGAVVSLHRAEQLVDGGDAGDGALRACGDGVSACNGARMRWLITLPAPSMKRCQSAGCAAG